MRFFVARTTGTTKLPISSDAVADAVKVGQLPLLGRSLRLDVDMDHVAGLGPLVAAHWHRWLHVFETAQTYGLAGLIHGGERCCQQPGDVSEVAALMTQVHGLQQLLQIEPSPLAAGHAASIHQGSDITGAVSSKPLVGGAQADPGLSRQLSQGLSVLNVSTHKL